MGQIFSIASQKGGVGKTTTALSLGIAFSRLNKKTLIIDADPQGGISFCLDRYYDMRRDQDQGRNGLYQVFCGAMDIAEAAQPSMIENLSVIDCGISARSSDIELYEDATRATGLFREAVIQAAQHYDTVLIDCPPGIGLVSAGALAASDYVIIPVQSEPLSLRTLPQLLRQLIAIKKEHNPDLAMAGILLTMYDHQSPASEMVAQQIRDFFEEDIVFKQAIPRDPVINLLFAGHENITSVLTEIEAQSAAFQAYQGLASEIAIQFSETPLRLNSVSN
ncbi:AAA family ATPase [bacterium]|nr:AAA family ATPase [bacterium]NUN45253.1 AAA family ATPase [bacterium]